METSIGNSAMLPESLLPLGGTTTTVTAAAAVDAASSSGDGADAENSWQEPFLMSIRDDNSTSGPSTSVVDHHQQISHHNMQHNTMIQNTSSSNTIDFVAVSAAAPKTTLKMNLTIPAATTTNTTTAAFNHQDDVLNTPPPVSDFFQIPSTAARHQLASAGNGGAACGSGGGQSFNMFKEDVMKNWGALSDFVTTSSSYDDGAALSMLVDPNEVMLPQQPQLVREELSLQQFPATLATATDSGSADSTMAKMMCVDGFAGTEAISPTDQFDKYFDQSTRDLKVEGGEFSIPEDFLEKDFDVEKYFNEKVLFGDELQGVGDQAEIAVPVLDSMKVDDEEEAVTTVEVIVPVSQPIKLEERADTSQFTSLKPIAAAPQQQPATVVSAPTTTTASNRSTAAAGRIESADMQVPTVLQITSGTASAAAAASSLRRATAVASSSVLAAATGGGNGGRVEKRGRGRPPKLAESRKITPRVNTRGQILVEDVSASGGGESCSGGEDGSWTDASGYLSEKEIHDMKYRRMRDLNNIASKRCRERRKMKFGELVDEVTRLEDEKASKQARLKSLHEQVQYYKGLMSQSLLRPTDGSSRQLNPNVAWSTLGLTPEQVVASFK